MENPQPPRVTSDAAAVQGQDTADAEPDAADVLLRYEVYPHPEPEADGGADSHLEPDGDAAHPHPDPDGDAADAAPHLESAADPGPHLEPDANAAPHLEHDTDADNNQIGWRWKRSDLRGTAYNINGYIRLQIVDHIRTWFKANYPEGLDELKGSCFGHFLRDGWDTGFCSNFAIHALFCNEVIRDGFDGEEFWYRVGSRFIKFCRRDYALITGLRFGGSTFDIHSKESPPAGSVFHRFAVISSNEPIDRVRDAFLNGVFKGPGGDAVKVAKVLMACYLVIGLDGQKKFQDTWLWTMVEEKKTWESFPWGLYSWLILSQYLRDLPVRARRGRTSRSSYHFYGNIYAFMVWACEAVPSLCERCVSRRISDAEAQRPRMTSYVFRKVVKANFKEFFNAEIECNESLEPTPDEEKELYMQNVDDPVHPNVRYNHRVSLCKRGRARGEHDINRGRNVRRRKSCKNVNRGARGHGRGDSLTGRDESNSEGGTDYETGRETGHEIGDEPSADGVFEVPMIGDAGIGMDRHVPEGTRDVPYRDGVNTDDTSVITDFQQLYNRIAEHIDRSIERVNAQTVERIDRSIERVNARTVEHIERVYVRIDEMAKDIAEVKKRLNDKWSLNLMVHRI